MVFLRDSRLFQTCCILAASALVLSSVPVPVFAQESTTRVPAGTALQVKFPQILETKALTAGQEINLMAAAAVMVGGVEVIAEGAPVTAEVARVKKPGAIGKPGEISIAFRFVMAVDGSKIGLTGQEGREGESKQTTALVVTILCCILGLLIKGGDVAIPAGTIVPAFTLTEANIST